MLQSELKKLQELGDLLQPPTGRKNKPVPDTLQLRTETEKECDRIRDALTRVIFTQPRENLAERYIQFHQAGIIQLADQLQTYLAAGAETELQLAAAFFITQLFDLLHYIERFFPKYFDLDAQIPEPYRLITLKQLGGPVCGILGLIGDRLQAAPLKSCLSDYLLSFSNEKFPASLRFRDLIYLKSFLNELEQFFNATEVHDPEAELSGTLIYLNFNHLGFLTYYQDRIRAELDHAGSREEHLAVLSDHRTHIKSLQSKPGHSYHPAWPSIKNMLENWLADELAAALLEQEKGPARLTADTESITEKMALNLSVAQIACFIRLFFEENCYATSSVTDILKFVVKCFRSKRQEHISPGSLSKEYYSTTQVTAATVRDLLQRMITRINKHYFPVWAAGCAIYLSWSAI